MRGAGRERAMPALLARGAHPNLLCRNGGTPTHRGAGTGLLPRRHGDPSARSTKEVTSLRVTASWSRCRCPEKKWGDPELQHQVGTRDAHREWDKHACERIPWDPQGAQGWALAQDPGGPRYSLTLLSEDSTEDPFSGPPAEPLSSTRRSLLDELDLGGDCSFGDPPLWRGCAPAPPSPSLTPWPPTAPGGAAVPPQPLASSTLLAPRAELREGPQGWVVVGRTRGVPWGVPKGGDGPGPSPHQGFGPGGSLSSPQPWCCCRGWGAHGASPRAPLLRGGQRCSGVSQSPSDGDIPGTEDGAPQEPPVGWAGLGVPATPDLGTRGAKGEDGNSLGDSSDLGDRSDLGDSSSASECFVSALETLEPSKDGGCLGAQHPCSPQPKPVVGLELGEPPCPAGAAALAVPPASPPRAERVQSEGLGGGSWAAPCCEGGSEVGDLGGVLVHLQGCSLQGSPPRTPDPLNGSAGLPAGGVTPQGTEPPRFRHVTPRTKRRLQASAARLGASSSSSLFEETLEMPRRPPRVRAPWGVPRHPPTAVGYGVTSRGEENVSSGDGEGTGSLGDTEILPGGPSQSSPPGSSSAVLLVPGDHGDPQDAPSDAQRSPGSSPTVLLVPGDHGDPQDAPSDAQRSPGSSPTVLLVPGDHGDPQDAPSDAQRSPGSSPTVLLVPGDHGDPQDAPSDAQRSPGSSPTVLLVPGDHGDPQDAPSDAQRSPGSSPTVLLVPGDHGDPQDAPSDAQRSPGSSPTVLLVPGDHGDPQDAPSDAQRSPGSSPTVLLVPGDHDHLHDPPSHAQGSPRATSSHNPRVLEDGCGWQDPSPLGTHQPQWPHGSLGHLLSPRPPGSPVVVPGSPATLPLPDGCSTNRPGQRHLKDEGQGRAPTERLSPGTEATTSPADVTAQDGRACPALPRRLSDEALRRRLRALGDDPGPITDLTRRLYLRRLEKLLRRHQGTTGGHSPELVAALRSGHIPDCAQDEVVLAQQFEHPDRNRHWREGLVKSSFNYLLLDPRTTENLPLRAHRLSPAECFRTFVKAIFYVGKGTRARPYCHLAEALSQHRAGTQKGCPKVQRILEIWASGHGVVPVHCFHNTIPAEAYTREGCLVEALGLQSITNQRKGNLYGAVARWPRERRQRLGVHMLHRAMRIFLAEGERQLRPDDIQGGH